MLRCSLLLAVYLCWSAAQAQTPAEVKGLIFYQDFDHGSTTLCGPGWAVTLPVQADRFVSGRFGQGYRMERSRTNHLSPNQASVEGGIEGFAAGAGVQLASVAVPTSYGEKALRAAVPQPGPMWNLEPLTLQVKAPHRPGKLFVLSVYLRAERPGAKVRLTLCDGLEQGGWRQKIEADNKATLEKDAKAKISPPRETVSEPGETVLDTSWQRVMALLEVDARRPEQQLQGRLELVEGSPVVVFADGLQLEQTAVYPTTNTAPTTWLPGGTSRGHGWLDVFAADTGFTGQSGTIACWVRPVPDECGGTRPVNAVVAIGTGWFNPIWQLGGGTWYAGDGHASGFRKGRLPGTAAERGLGEPGDHDGWHHWSLAWDDRKAVGYLDGKPFGRCEVESGQLAPGTAIRLGGSFLEGTPMNGDLDEVAVYRQRLSDSELAALAGRERPLAAELPRVLVRRPARMAFLRSEPQAEIELEPVAYAAPEDKANGGGLPADRARRQERPAAQNMELASQSSARASVQADIPAVQATLSGPTPASPSARLNLRPWLASAGKHPIRVRVEAGADRATIDDFIEVFEEPAGREFIIYAWGGGDDLHQRGFNSAVAAGRGAHRQLLERGLWAQARIDVRDGVPHPWSPQTRAAARPIAQSVARAAMANPNVVALLVNSEVGDPPFPATDQTWFYEWMKQETGLAEIPAEVARPPLHVASTQDNAPPAVVPETHPAFRFLRWWKERGQGYWLLNGQLARWMREAGLTEVKYYSDQPVALTQFEQMDLVDFWGYPRAPEGLVAEFAHAENIARLLGKPFQAMPGTVYWDDGNGLWVTDDDGKRKVLCLSPDCLRENLWLSVACPSSSIGLYGLGERKTEVYDRACDDVLTETYGLISPVGTLVGGLPMEQPKVALLETDGLYFIQPGAGNNWVRHWLVRTASRTLARARLPFDFLTDDHVAAGWLDRYQAVVVPGAWCLPQQTHEALVAYANQGGKVLADQVLRAEIPGVQRLAIPNQAYARDVAERELGGWARAFRDARRGWAQVSPSDRVFSYTREAGAARYVFVINDHREPGPQFERWKVTLPNDGGGPLRDRGLPQEVTLSVPAGFALYDVLAHRRLDAQLHQGRQTCQLTLAPGAAAVVAALPAAVASLDLPVPGRIAPGSETNLLLTLRDESDRPPAGRQLAEVTVTSPSGPWCGTQRYQRIQDGQRIIPLRLPLTATPGQWRIRVQEWVSGLEVEKVFEVR